MNDFYNKYPYTDFHELNLDWVIDRVKKLTEDWLATHEEWAGVQQDWADTEQAWIDFKAYVENYLANLDVQDEIDHKIDQMVADGSLRTLIRPDVEAQAATSTEAWLTSHIVQPTTPVIDNTLTIATAGADAAVTGKDFASQYSSSTSYYPGNTVLYNGVLYMCKVATSPEMFNPDHWELVNTGDMSNISFVNDDRILMPVEAAQVYSYQANNGASYNAATMTMSIPAGSSGNGSYINTNINREDLTNLTGHTVVLRILFESSIDIQKNMTGLLLTNLTNTIKHYLINGHEMIIVVDLPAQTISSSSYLAVRIIKATGSPVSATSYFKQNSVLTEIFDLQDFIRFETTRERNFADTAQRLTIDYETIVQNLQNGAVLQSDGTITVPAGYTGNNTYQGGRFLTYVNLLRGRTIKANIYFTVDHPEFNFTIDLLSNNTGVTILERKIDRDAGTGYVIFNMAEDATNTYVIPAIRILNVLQLTYNVNIKITNIESFMYFNDAYQIKTSFEYNNSMLMSCFGHSMVQQSRWQPIVVQDCDLLRYENTAIFGGLLTNNYADISNIDSGSGIVVVWYDTNDWANNKTLGSIGDNETTPTTFAGCLKYVCNYISTNLPKAKIILVSSPKRFDNVFGTTDVHGYQINNNGDTLEDFADIIKEVADLYSCKYCDLFHKSGCNKDNYLTYLDADALHPNYYGAYIMGNMIADAINS